MSNCSVSLLRGLIGVLESRCRLTSQHANLLTLNLLFYDLPNLRKQQFHMNCGGRGVIRTELPWLSFSLCCSPLPSPTAMPSPSANDWFQLRNISKSDCCYQLAPSYLISQLDYLPLASLLSPLTLSNLFST